MIAFKKLQELALGDRTLGYKRLREGFLMRCLAPCHGADGFDETPSLLVKEGPNGEAILKCFGGCPVSEVIRALENRFPELASGEKMERGCRLSDIFPEDLIPAVSELISETREGLVIPMMSFDGTLYRFYRVKADGPNKNRLEKGAPGSQILWTSPDRMVRRGEILFVLESPVDAITLTALGFRSVAGVGKKNSPKALKAWRERDLLNLPPDLRIIVWQEWDAQDFPEEVADALGRDVEVLTPPSPDIKDPLRIVNKWGTEKFVEWLEAKISTSLPKVKFLVEDGLPVIGPDEVIARADTKKTEIICGLLSKGQIGILVGPPRAGKSTLALNLVRSLREGEPFLGFPTRRCRTLYVFFEKGELVALRAKELGLDDLLMLDGLQYYLTMEKLKNLEALIKRLQIDFIILDPFIFFAYPFIRDENDLKSYTKVYHFLSELRRFAQKTDISFLLLHHPRKMPAELRGKGMTRDDVLGSRALTAGPDLVLLLQPKGDDFLLSIDANGLLEMELRILRDDVFFHVTPEEERELPIAEKAIIESLQDKGLGFNGLLREASNRTPKGLAKASFYRALKRLMHRGTIYKQEGKYWLRKRETKKTETFPLQNLDNSTLDKVSHPLKPALKPAETLKPEGGLNGFNKFHKGFNMSETCSKQELMRVPEEEGSQVSEYIKCKMNYSETSPEPPSERVFEGRPCPNCGGRLYVFAGDSNCGRCISCGGWVPFDLSPLAPPPLSSPEALPELKGRSKGWVCLAQILKEEGIDIEEFF